jgi:hypothetical protein
MTYGTLVLTIKKAPFAKNSESEKPSLLQTNDPSIAVQEVVERGKPVEVVPRKR